MFTEFQEWKANPSTHKVTETPLASNAVGYMKIQKENLGVFDDVGWLYKINIMQSKDTDQTKGQILIVIKDISRYTPLERILLTSMVQFLSTKCHEDVNFAINPIRKYSDKEKLRFLQESHNEHSTEYFGETD